MKVLKVKTNFCNEFLNISLFPTGSKNLLEVSAICKNNWGGDCKFVRMASEEEIIQRMVQVVEEEYDLGGKIASHSTFSSGGESFPLFHQFKI